MCQIDDQLLLVENDKARLTKCKVCGTYNLIYNNAYLVFSKGELVGFRNTITELTEIDFNKDHPSGQPNVLLKNNRTLMGVTFSQVEIEELLVIIQEAELYEEVFSILHQK